MKKYIPITAEPHTPPYKIHKYFARRPWNVFSQLIKVFSNPNDVVLDPFMGGGVTIYEALKLNRKVIGFDLNPLSVFIVKNMIKKSNDIQKFDNLYKDIQNYINYLYSDYETISYDSKQASLFPQRIPIEWNELAFNVFCNYCGEKVLLSNDNKLSNGRYLCKNKSCKSNKGFIEPKNCKRDGYTYLFSVAINPQTKEKMKIPHDKNRINKTDSHINFLKKELKKINAEIPKDKIPLNWDRQLEDLLERKNIVYFQDLFTEKNLYINILIKEYIDNLPVDKSTRELFRLVFSSSLRDTNIMAFTNDFWQSGSPTTWSKHAYWVPSQFCEVNILSAFERAYKRVKSSLLYNADYSYDVNFTDKFEQLNADKNIYLSSTSVSENNVPDNFVDAIITDPPYGSNVQYLELSHFWFIWNKDLYDVKQVDFSKEAVSNRKKNFMGAKSMYDYESNLSKVFNMCYKVLKPGKYMTLTFNNKDISAWLAIIISILKAGFEFSELYFQDGVKNYKQTAHTKYEGSPYGDYIYVFLKPNESKKIPKKFSDENEFINELDKFLNTHLKTFEKDKHVRADVIKSMFSEVIPLIESYAKNNLLEDGEHKLYKHFNKNYMNNLYE